MRVIAIRWVRCADACRLSVRNFWYLKFIRDRHRRTGSPGARRARHRRAPAVLAGGEDRLAQRHPSAASANTPRFATDWLDFSVLLRRAIDFVRFLTPRFVRRADPAYACRAPRAGAVSTMRSVESAATSAYCRGESTAPHRRESALPPDPWLHNVSGRAASRTCSCSRRSSHWDRRNLICCTPRSGSGFRPRWRSAAGIICPQDPDTKRAAGSSAGPGNEMAAAGGAGLPRHRSGPRDGHRRAVLRRLVRPASISRIATRSAKQVGLPGGQPYVLYVCSALLKEPSEAVCGPLDCRFA